LLSCQNNPASRNVANEEKPKQDPLWLLKNAAKEQKMFDFDQGNFLQQQKGKTLYFGDGTTISPGKLKRIRRTFDYKSGEGSGGWGGSGGSGVVCFEDQRTAKKAIRWGYLRDKYYSKIKNIYVLDYYEHKGDNFFPLNSPNETSEQYLERILFTYIYPLAPYFTTQLLEAINAITQEQWINNNKLKFLPDLARENAYEEPPRPIPSNCARVQLVIRYSKHRVCKKPYLFMDVNSKLLEKINELNTPEIATINKAFLILHEALYLIGSEIGHGSSYYIRSFTNQLLSKDNLEMYQRLSKAMNNDNYQAQSFLSALEVWNFSQSQILYLKKTKSTPPYTKQSRRISRAITKSVQKGLYYYFSPELINEIKEAEKKAKDHVSRPPFYIDFSKAKDPLLRTLSINPFERGFFNYYFFTDEEEFLLQVEQYFGHGRIKQHSDILMIDHVDDKALLKESCHLLTQEFIGNLYGNFSPLSEYIRRQKGRSMEQHIQYYKDYEQALFEQDEYYLYARGQHFKALRYCHYLGQLPKDSLETYEHYLKIYDPPENSIYNRVQKIRCGD
jgi:hypothetical protein